MSMFLWTRPDRDQLTTPAGTPTSGRLRRPDRGTSTSPATVGAGRRRRRHRPSDGCEPIVNDRDRQDRRVRSDRGACNSACSVDNAQAAGAIGVIVDQRAARRFSLRPAGSGSAAPAPGPHRSATRDGNALKAALASGPVSVTLHRSRRCRARRRLRQRGSSPTSGATTCTTASRHARPTQCGAMSEGWGDFVALHMMLRAADDRERHVRRGRSYALTRGAISAFDGPGVLRHPPRTRTASTARRTRSASATSATTTRCPTSPDQREPDAAPTPRSTTPARSGPRCCGRPTRR